MSPGNILGYVAIAALFAFMAWVIVQIRTRELQAKLNGLQDELSDSQKKLTESYSYLEVSDNRLRAAIAENAKHAQVELQAAMLADAGPILARYQKFCVFMNRNFKSDCETAQQQHPPLSIFDVAENVMVLSQSDREKFLLDQVADLNAALEEAKVATRI